MDVDPEILAEAERATAESRPYVTGRRAQVIRCEYCGTDLMMVPEAPASDPCPEWAGPAAWESASWLRHTPRRCGWLREWKLKGRSWY